MAIPEYVTTVFGQNDVPSVFSKHRKHFKKTGMTKSKPDKLVEAGTMMILTDSLNDSPYSDSLMEMAYSSRNNNIS